MTECRYCGYRWQDPQQLVCPDPECSGPPVEQHPEDAVARFTASLASLFRVPENPAPAPPPLFRSAPLPRPRDRLHDLRPRGPRGHDHE